MVEVNLGAIRFNWRGAYAGGTAYVADDVVSSGGSSYICILASTGNAVSNATYWSQMSAAGTDGTDLTSTLTTQGDVLYRDGSGLQRLAKGTAAQLLTMNAGATAPEWGAAPASGSNSFKVSGQSLGTQSISTSAWTKMTFVETGGDAGLQWDKGGEFDPSTSQYTPTTAGTYIIHVFAYIHSVGDTKTAQALIYKNGSAYYGAAGKQVHGAADHAYAFITDLVNMNGTSDYIEGYAYQNTGSTTNIDSRRHMWGYRIGA